MLNDDAARRDRRSTAVAVGILVVFLTVIAAPILAIAAISFSDDRATLDAYNAAPICTARAAADTSCKRLTEYHVSSEYGHAGQDSVYYLYLTDSSSAQIRVQLTSPTGVWPAADWETVTVTSWRGTPASVAYGRNVSQLIDSPALETGGGAYVVLVLVGAVYLYLVLIVLTRRMAGSLLLVPAAILITGIALHSRIVGGPWTHDFLLFIVGAPVVLFLIELLPTRGTARRVRRTRVR